MGIAYNPKTVTDGLVLCLDAANPKSYPGSGTTWFDSTGNGITGTILTGVTYSTDPSKFDTNATAITDLRHLTTPTISFVDTSPYSMEFWIKLRPSAGATYHSLTGHGSTSPWLSVFCNDTTGGRWALRYRQSGGTYIASTAITDWNIQSNWASICISVSPSREISFYLNGALRQVLNPTTTLFNVNRVAGGYSSGGNYFPLQGSIAAVKIYNRTLSAAEIQQNFQAMKERYGV